MLNEVVDFFFLDGVNEEAEEVVVVVGVGVEVGVEVEVGDVEEERRPC